MGPGRRWGNREMGGWGEKAQRGFLASGIDPADQRGHKNYYIDLLQKMALDDVLGLKGDEIVLDFGCGSGRISYWIAPQVKNVVGLEVTPEMIHLAEENRIASNVEFIFYDGLNFPKFPFKFDLIFSIGVLQIMRGEVLGRTVSHLADYLKRDGRGYFIEQVSDNPEVGRPKLAEYLQAFHGSGLECLRCYPIRRGRWWLLYLIRYGLMPRKWFQWIAQLELGKRRDEKGVVHFYKDFLFLLRKK